MNLRLQLAALTAISALTAEATTNRVLRLDGIDDFVEIASASALMPTEEITLEAWLNPQSQPGDPVARWLTKSDGLTASSSRSYEWYQAGDTTELYLFLGSSTYAGVAVSTPRFQWTHVAMTYDRSLSLFRAFTNGTLAIETTLDAAGAPINGKAIRSSSLPLRIGKILNGWFANGLVDDLRIWNQARTEEEIKRDLSRKLTGKEVSLVAWWNFDQADVTDATGNGFSGVKGGDVAFDSDLHAPAPKIHHALAMEVGEVYPTTPGQLERAYSLPASIWLPEGASVLDAAPVLVSTQDLNQGTLRMAMQSNRALRLDGVNDLVTVANSMDLVPKSEITIECWMYPERTSTVTHQGWMSKGDGVDAFSNRSYEIRYTAEGVMAALFLGDVSGSKTYAELTVPAPLSNWVHIAATYIQSESTLRLYTNGVLAAQTNLDAVGNPLNSRPIRSSTAPLQFGQIGNYTGSRATGMIDDARIWNEAKTIAEIRRDMARPLTGKEAGLVAWWDFNAGTGADRTGLGHTGTFSGGPVLVSENMQPVITASRAVEVTFPVDVPTTFYRLQGSVASDLGPWLNIGDAFSGPLGTARAFAPNLDGQYQHLRVVRD